MTEEVLRNKIRDILLELSPATFKNAVELMRGRGHDRRINNLGSLFFNKFKGKELLGGKIQDITTNKPQSGNYFNMAVHIKIPKKTLDGQPTDVFEDKYVYYDIHNDEWEVDEITRKDAVILSAIAKHIKPDTQYGNGAINFKIKGYQ